jgi:hypothetical protein
MSVVGEEGYVRAMVELVSWNVNRRQVWDELTSADDVDIALLQEAPRPPTGTFLNCVPDIAGDWSTTHWKTELRTCITQLSDRVALVPRMLRDAGDDDSAALGVSRKGSLAVADVRRSGEDFLFTVASAYAAWESPPGRNDIIYADASAHRLLSDISGLVTGRRGEKLLVAGDFNILFGYGEHGDAYFAARYQSVFDRAAAMGLQLIGPRQATPWPAELPLDNGNVPTFHHSRQTPETATRQLDFVFATANIADKVQVRALNGIGEWGPSDHCRVAISVNV